MREMNWHERQRLLFDHYSDLHAWWLTIYEMQHSWNAKNAYQLNIKIVKDKYGFKAVHTPLLEYLYDNRFLRTPVMVGRWVNRSNVGIIRKTLAL